MWRRKRLSCREAGGKCEFNIEHGQVYNSPDGKVFRVRRARDGGEKAEERLCAAGVAAGRRRGGELLKGGEK